MARVESGAAMETAALLGGGVGGEAEATSEAAWQVRVPGDHLVYREFPNWDSKANPPEDYLTATARASLTPFPRPPTLCTAPPSPSTLPLVKPIRVCDVLHDGRRILRVLIWPTLPSPASGFRHCTLPLSPPPCIDDRVLVSPPRPPPSPPPLPPSRPPLPASPADGRLWWRRVCHDGRRGGRRPAARLALPPRLPLPRGRPRQPAVARPPGARRPQRRPDAAAGAAGPLRRGVLGRGPLGGAARVWQPGGSRGGRHPAGVDAAARWGGCHPEGGRRCRSCWRP